MNRAMIGQMMIESKYDYIVYGSVRGLVSEHKYYRAAIAALRRDQSGCKYQGGYSDAQIYKATIYGWEIVDAG